MSNDYQALLATLHEESGRIVESWLDEARVSDPAARRSAQAEAADILRQLGAGLQAGADPARFDAPAWASLRETMEKQNFSTDTYEDQAAFQASMARESAYIKEIAAKADMKK